MNILDFLTNNAVLVIIVIGVLSSLFSGSRKRAREARRTANRMPSFGSGSSYADEENSMRRTETATSGRSGRTVTRYEDSFPSVENEPDIDRGNDRVAEWSQIPESYHVKVELEKSTSPRSLPGLPGVNDLTEYREDVRTLAPSAESDRWQRIDPRHAVQGMMWAEVFGPPKSRRPHYSLRRR